jgi:hypothetical protein
MFEDLSQAEMERLQLALCRADTAVDTLADLLRYLYEELEDEDQVAQIEHTFESLGLDLL